MEGVFRGGRVGRGGASRGEGCLKGRERGERGGRGLAGGIFWWPSSNSAAAWSRELSTSGPTANFREMFRLRKWNFEIGLRSSMEVGVLGLHVRSSRSNIEVRSWGLDFNVRCFPSPRAPATDCCFHLFSVFSIFRSTPLPLKINARKAGNAFTQTQLMPLRV